MASTIYRNDIVSYGYPYKVISYQDGHEENLTHTNLRSLSQEHGIIHLSLESMDKVNIGDTILVYPVHSCLTANLTRQIIIV